MIVITYTIEEKIGAHRNYTRRSKKSRYLCKKKSPRIIGSMNETLCGKGSAKCSTESADPRIHLVRRTRSPILQLWLNATLAKE
jgi:hypothetical protein